jgi:hypothetical protein
MSDTQSMERNILKGIQVIKALEKDFNYLKSDNPEVQERIQETSYLLNIIMQSMNVFSLHQLIDKDDEAFTKSWDENIERWLEIRNSMSTL